MQCIAEITDHPACRSRSNPLKGFSQKAIVVVSILIASRRREKRQDVIAQRINHVWPVLLYRGEKNVSTEIGCSVRINPIRVVFQNVDGIIFVNPDEFVSLSRDPHSLARSLKAFALTPHG